MCKIQGHAGLRLDPGFCACRRYARRHHRKTGGEWRENDGATQVRCTHSMHDSRGGYTTRCDVAVKSNLRSRAGGGGTALVTDGLGADTTISGDDAPSPEESEENDNGGVLLSEATALGRL